MEIKRIEYYDDRYYKIEGLDKNDQPTVDYLESVTTVLGAYPKPWLARFRGDVGNREADLRMREGMDKGSNVHDYCRLLTQGCKLLYVPKNELAPPPEEGVIVLRKQDEYLAAYKFWQWMKVVKPKVWAVEMTVYSMTEHVAGTMDYLFEVEGGAYAVAGSKPLELAKGLYVADLKTGHGVDDDAFLQTAAYASAWEEMGLVPTEEETKIVGTLIIHTEASTKNGVPGLTTLKRTREELLTDYEDFKSVHKVWRRKYASARPNVSEFPRELSL